MSDRQPEIAESRLASCAGVEANLEGARLLQVALVDNAIYCKFNCDARQ